MSPRVRSVRIRNMALSLADLPHIYIRAETCMTRSLQWHHPDHLALHLLYLIRLMSHGLLSTPEASDDLPYIYSGSLPHPLRRNLGNGHLSVTHPCNARDDRVRPYGECASYRIVSSLILISAHEIDFSHRLTPTSC
jgi:hypothetical protein